MDDSSTPKTILIADDTAFVRDRFKAAIEAAGHQAITVKTAAELHERVRTDLTELDLVVLDLHLSPAAGTEMIRGIRKVDGGQLPVVVFSGSILRSEEVRDMAALGVAGYINEYTAVQHIVPALAPHLFPDDFNRRGSPRVALGIPIAYRFGQAVAAALTLNMSRGGIAIRTSSPLEKDTGARVRFRLPGSPKDIDAEAVVKWCERNGMGLRLKNVPDADQTAIDEFVDTHFFLSHQDKDKPPED